MIRKTVLTASLAAGLALSFSAPAHATWGHKPICKWGKKCHGTSSSGGTTTSSGGHTSTGGNTSSGGNTSTGGNTSSGGATSSGGTKVPEPGMLGLMGLGLAGLAVARRKTTRRD